jgi:hypothetical protein
MSFIVCNSDSAAIASRYSEAVATAEKLANESGLPTKIFRLPSLAEKIVRPQIVTKAPQEPEKPKVKKGRKK